MEIARRAGHSSVAFVNDRASLPTGNPMAVAKLDPIRTTGLAAEFGLARGGGVVDMNALP